MMIMRGLAAWLLATVLLTSVAYAHGGVGLVDNRCVLRIGPDIMFFTGYQPQNSREEFCDDVPNTGRRLSRSICRNASSEICSRKSVSSRTMEPIRR